MTKPFAKCLHCGLENDRAGKLMSFCSGCDTYYQTHGRFPAVSEDSDDRWVGSRWGVDQEMAWVPAGGWKR